METRSENTDHDATKISSNLVSTVEVQESFDIPQTSQPSEVIPPIEGAEAVIPAISNASNASNTESIKSIESKENASDISNASNNTESTKSIESKEVTHTAISSAISIEHPEANVDLKASALPEKDAAELTSNESVVNIADTHLTIPAPVAAEPVEKLYLSTTRFSSLPLHDSLQEALEDIGFTFCTPIQAQSLPHLLNGKDLTGQAQTGTGKSAAFLLTILNHLMVTPVSDDSKGPYAIVLAPTRELALQIYKDAASLGRYTGLKSCAVYGGTGYETQKKLLEEGVDLIIGTPGRVIDFFKQGVFSLKNIEVFVLDEADRMFDLGFVADIRYLLSKMPAPGQRLNMLFSATFSQRVLELAYEHMNNPEKVIIESEQITGDRITQHLFHVASTDKIKLLFGLLNREKPSRSIIFVNTKRIADEVSAYLEANDVKAAVLSGDIPQNRRERLLESFKHGILPVLVATDVAARGLHIPEVSHVFNYDLPQDVEDYVHRIGRTARAGAEGTAISFACEEYVYSLPDIEEYIGQGIPVAEIEDGLLVEPNAPKFVHRAGSRKSSNNRRIGGHSARRNQAR